MCDSFSPCSSYVRKPKAKNAFPVMRKRNWPMMFPLLKSRPNTTGNCQCERLCWSLGQETSNQNIHSAKYCDWGDNVIAQYVWPERMIWTYSIDLWFLHWMHGQPGHNTRLHARLSPSFLSMCAWMTLQLNVAFIRKGVLGHWCAWLILWRVIGGCLYNQALADVRSTGAGSKCLYCISHKFIFLYISCSKMFSYSCNIILVSRSTR